MTIYILSNRLHYSDQHQISPCNITACSTPEFLRIRDMITQSKFLDILTSPQCFCKNLVWGQDRRICSLILGVKGLIHNNLYDLSYFLVTSSLTCNLMYFKNSIRNQL